MTGARVAALAALVLVTAPGLVGCGHRESYCGAVKSHQADLGAIVHSSDRTALIRALPDFEDLAGTAPDDVAADWQLLVGRIQALQSALADAGVDPATYDAKKPPANLSAGDRARIERAAAQLVASDTRQALTTVQQEVLDVCHTPLDL